MFPYVDIFLKNFRQTGQDMKLLQTPPGSVTNIIRGFGGGSAGGVSASSPLGMRLERNSGLLEEIAEVPEENEHKRGK